MSSELAKADNQTALDILSGNTPDAPHVSAASFLSVTWKKSGEEQKEKVRNAGYKLGPNDVVFGVLQAGNLEICNPFQFYLLASQPIFTTRDSKGVTERMVTKIPKGDPDEEDFKEDYLALLAVQQGKTIVPVFASAGRFRQAMAKVIKNATIQQAKYKATDLESRGDQFAVAAKVKQIPFRVLFTGSAKVRETTSGEFEYPAGDVSSRPITIQDAEIQHNAGVTDTESAFYADFRECLSIYQRWVEKATNGWTKGEDDNS